MSVKVVRYISISCLVILAAWILGADRTAGQRVCCQGDQWLNWSLEQRNNFVYGYFVGYNHGYMMGCSHGTEDWPKPAKPGFENIPINKCLEQALDFSKGTEHYAKSITEFYKQYPQDRDIYFDEVLEQLGKGLTLEQIHDYPFWRRGRPPAFCPP